MRHCERCHLPVVNRPRKTFNDEPLWLHHNTGRVECEFLPVTYECSVCAERFDDAVPAEDERGNVIYICYEDYLKLEWKDET